MKSKKGDTYRECTEEKMEQEQNEINRIKRKKEDGNKKK